MIELTDYQGNKVLIHTKDIREVRGYFDQRYPSIQSVIILYDGKKIECSHPYNVVKNLTIQRVSVSLPSKDEVVSELYARVYNGEYKKRNVMRNNMQDCYYSGYLDCFDKLAGNER